MKKVVLVTILLVVLCSGCVNLNLPEKEAQVIRPTKTPDPLITEDGVYYKEDTRMVAAATFRYRTTDDVVFQGGFDFFIDAYPIKVTNLAYGEFVCNSKYEWQVTKNSQGEEIVQLVKKNK